MTDLELEDFEYGQLGIRVNNGDEELYVIKESGSKLIKIEDQLEIPIIVQEEAIGDLIRALKIMYKEVKKEKMNIVVVDQEEKEINDEIIEI